MRKIMSSMSSVAGLSKYITTLPKIKFSIVGMTIISILTGILYFLVDNTGYGLLEEIIYGGLYSLLVIGVPSIMSGAVNQQIIQTLDGINVKLKHSMFLSGLSMTIQTSMQLLRQKKTVSSVSYRHSQPEKHTPDRPPVRQ